MAAKVYSYIRFSTPEQELGDSERRQMEAAKRYATKRSLELDETLRDRGLSGYHGTNRKRGALGSFLRAVEQGEVSGGSVLVVENIDRLSREDFLQAFEIISAILRRDISIVTLMPEAEYTRESLRGGMIYSLVGQIQLAHEESSKKAERGKSNWIQKRNNVANNRHIATARRPAWIDIEQDGRVLTPEEIAHGTVKHDTAKFVLNPHAAKSIRMLFAMALEGLGKGRIAIKLNKSAPWRPPNGWRESYIAKCMRNIACIGQFQPHRKVDGRRVPEGDPIKDYYPAAIEPETFYAVQKLLDANKRTGGQVARASNLFTRLVKCAYCGSPMRYADKGTPPKGQKYLICDRGARRAGCKRYAVRYDEFEDTMLANLHRLQPEAILPNPAKQAQLVQSLRDRINGLDGQLSEVSSQIDNLVDQVARTKSKTIRDKYETRIGALETRQIELKASLKSAKSDLTEAERSSSSVKSWVKGLAELAKALKKPNTDLRLKVRAHIRELVDRIEIFAEGYATEFDSDKHDLAERKKSDALREEVESMAAELGIRTKEVTPFLDWLMKRRLSREGRFYRVYSRLGAKWNVVPAGSLASGLKRRPKGGRDAIRPDLAQLWDEFTNLKNTGG